LGVPAGEILATQKLEISEAIVKVAELNENLCMFSCVYNAMRIPEGRMALAAGNMENPAEAFRNVAQSNRHVKDRLQEGYTAFDMQLYLHWLKTEGVVKGYTWKLARSVVWERLFIQKKGLDSGNGAVVIFGATMRSTEKEAMLRRFRKQEERLKHLSERKKQAKLIEYYESGMPKKIQDLVYNKELTHGVALNRDEEGTVWLYDNGKKTRRKMSGVQDVAMILPAYWRAYFIEIELN
jgi:hypothetical protein